MLPVPGTVFILLSFDLVGLCVCVSHSMPFFFFIYSEPVLNSSGTNASFAFTVEHVLYRSMYRMTRFDKTSNA